MQKCLKHRNLPCYRWWHWGRIYESLRIFSQILNQIFWTSNVSSCWTKTFGKSSHHNIHIFKINKGTHNSLVLIMCTTGCYKKNGQSNILKYVRWLIFFLTPCRMPQIMFFYYVLLGILVQVGFTHKIHNILIYCSSSFLKRSQKMWYDW